MEALIILLNIVGLSLVSWVVWVFIFPYAKKRGVFGKDDSK